MKYRKSLLILLIISSFFGTAQQSETPDPGKQKDNLSLNIGYGVGGYGIFDVPGLAGQNSVINSEIGAALTAEIGIEVKLSNNFRLFTGTSLQPNRYGIYDRFYKLWNIW